MPELVAVGVVLIVAAAFVVLLIRARRPSTDANGSAALYDRPCSVVVPMPLGFQFGSNFSASRVKLFRDRLVITGVVKIDIQLEQILSIGLARRWFSQGVQVLSTNERWRKIFIYVRKPKDLVELIERQRSVKGPNPAAPIEKSKLTMDSNV